MARLEPLSATVQSGGRVAAVSLCMIVRDEETKLAACLGSVSDLVGEMIVVDTGSTDQTKEVATRAGAKVFDFPWVDDFAAAPTKAFGTPRAIGYCGWTPTSFSTTTIAGG